MILIIDDDQSIRASLGFLLKKAGYQVMAVATPDETLQIIRKETFDLILMDMNFSLSTTGEEGLILLRQVKIFQPKVPVILMTAWGSIQLAVQGMQAGAFDFITKPWDNRALLKVIKTAIDLNASSGTNPLTADTMILSWIGTVIFARCCLMNGDGVANNNVSEC